MKPENLTRINRELDGEDYDLNALVDFVIDRKADGQQSENIYTNACENSVMLPYRSCSINRRPLHGPSREIRCSLTHIPAAGSSRSRRKALC